jgi:hypothetical protein
MKNPLEYSMLEIDALLHADPDGPHVEFASVLRYVHERQLLLREYQVQKDLPQIKARREPVTRRKERSLDLDLLDAAEIVTIGEVSDLSTCEHRGEPDSN